MTKTVERALFENTPEIQHFAELSQKNNVIDRELYTKYDVKKAAKKNMRIILRSLQRQEW